MKNPIPMPGWVRVYRARMDERERSIKSGYLQMLDGVVSAEWYPEVEREVDAQNTIG